MGFRRSALATLTLVLFLSTVAGAETDKGSIEGRVVKAGQGVGGVTIIVNETKAVAITEQDGSFDFVQLPPGGYTLVLSLGDNTLTYPGVAVDPDGSTVIEIEVDWEIGVYESVKVTAIAARAAKIVDAPAAVTSINEEQIEREASHGQLPKVLEYTPGAEVTQSGLYDFNFNTRGFNSSLNRRVSTYIDGRDVGVVLLGAQEWAAITVLDDLAGVEFIRGPSAALYGANASSGVVNMTSKNPRDSQGGLLRTTVGELDTFSMDFRRADELGHGWYYRVLGGLRFTGDYSIARDPDEVAAPEYALFCQQIGQNDCLPKEKPLFREQNNRIQFGTVRLDKYLTDASLLSFETGVTNIEGPVFQTGIGRVQILNARRPFFRFAYSDPHWTVLGHYAGRTGDQANLTKGLVLDFELLTDDKRYGVEAQGNWNFGGDRGRFVIGAAHTEERVDTANPETGRQTVVFEPLSTNRQAIFSQLDWRLNEHFKLVFAGRLDENTLHDLQFSPKAAVVYKVNPEHSFRLTFNKAFQVANYSEFFLHARTDFFGLPGLANSICVTAATAVLGAPVDCGITEPAPILAVGNDDLKIERTRAWELGYTGVLGKRAFLTVDYYNSKNFDFISDLVPQQGTSLGSPINPDYLPWVSTEEAETTILSGNLTVAQALRNSVNQVVGFCNPPPGRCPGFALAQDLDGSTVIVGRTYINLGEVNTQGVDFGLQYFVNDQWTLQASYSWFDFEIIDAQPDVELILLPNSPRHKAALTVGYARNAWDVNLSGRWVDDFNWAAGAFQGPVPAYSSVDLNGNYRLNDTVSLGLTAANLRNNDETELCTSGGLCNEGKNLARQTFGGDLLYRRALLNLTFNW